LSIARWRCPDLTPFLRETLAHEEEHAARFRALMPDRASRPCRMMWLWGVGGLLLGGLTALLGRRGVLVCTEAVERTVHRHLDDQIRFLTGRDPELANAIAEIQQQELEHLEFASSRLDRPTVISRTLEVGISVATEVLIWLSTRGDSLRLARELRAA
jgi:ubiquinone biosynthesis monooxygenase Coq7